MDSLGIVTISDRAVKHMAAELAKRCKGVAQLCDRSKRDELSRILNSSKNVRGVYLTKTKEGKVLDIFLLSEYGANAGDICNTLTAQLEEALRVTGIRLLKVNVHIIGVKQV